MHTTLIGAVGSLCLPDLLFGIASHQAATTPLEERQHADQELAPSPQEAVGAPGAGRGWVDGRQRLGDGPTAAHSALDGNAQKGHGLTKVEHRGSGVVRAELLPLVVHLVYSHKEVVAEDGNDAILPGNQLSGEVLQTNVASYTEVAGWAHRRPTVQPEVDHQQGDAINARGSKEVLFRPVPRLSDIPAGLVSMACGKHGEAFQCEGAAPSKIGAGILRLEAELLPPWGLPLVLATQQLVPDTSELGFACRLVRRQRDVGNLHEAAMCIDLIGREGHLAFDAAAAAASTTKDRGTFAQKGLLLIDDSHLSFHALVRARATKTDLCRDGLALTGASRTLR